MKIKQVSYLGIFQHVFWMPNSGSKWTHSNTVWTGFMDAFTDLPVLKAEKFNVIIIALKQLQTSARRDNNSQDKPPIRDWQGASSLFSSCYWDLLGPSSTESSTELLGPFSSEWQVWKGTTTWGASVIADLGQVMAAACGTPALGPWIGQSMIKLWFRACSSHVLIMYSNCLFHVHSKFRSTKEYALPVSI